MSDSENISSSESVKDNMETEDVGPGGDATGTKEDQNGHKPNAKGDADVSDEEEAKNNGNEGDESEEEDSDSDEPTPKKSINDGPLVIEDGKKRERKKVERIEMTPNQKEEKPFEVPEGQGEKLGDLPRVEHMLAKNKADDLKFVHKVLYKVMGKTGVVKKHIRLFNGFDFDKDSSEYTARTNTLYRANLAMLKFTCDILDVPRKGTKENIVDRIMEFCLKPVASGKKVKEPKRRKSKGEKGEKRKRKSKKSGDKDKSKKVKSKAKADSSDDEDEKEDSDDEEVKDEEEKESSSEAESESEEEESPQKKKAKVEKPAKKKPSKPVKKPKKVATPSDSSDDSSDDEPLKPKKKSPPSNGELKKLVKNILDNANLEEVTMKTVCRQVYDKYPEFDLSDRKDFIKSTVKDLIR